MAAAALQTSSGLILCRGRELFQDPTSCGGRKFFDHSSNRAFLRDRTPRPQEWENCVLASSRCAASKGLAIRAEDSKQPAASAPQNGQVLCGEGLVTADGGSRISRRAAGIKLGAAALASLVILPATDAAIAVQQTLLAGRVPGLSDPDSDGRRTYRRPDAKSGGHGVGWSPIIPYSFKVPGDGWQEVPVSIADLGGTEIDLRFANAQEGNLSVIVAPVLRFSDSLGDNATIEKVGTPEMVINAFGPEVIGKNVEGLVKGTDVKEYEGRKYYQYELENPHVLINATAAGNRLYLLSLSANGRQWKKFAPTLKQILDSFRVDSA